MALLLGICACGGANSKPNDDPTPGSSGTALRNIDVTVIYPLPAAARKDALLKASDSGNHGPLLPSSAFDQGQVPELDARAPVAGDAERLATLRVLAIRFDPCARVTLPPPPGTTCQPEIRLALQSLREENGKVQARDGAMHTFYRLTQDEWTAILNELRAVRAENASAPEVKLGAHPLLESQGPNGAYAQRIKALVLAHAGEQNLVRVTHFRRKKSPEQGPFNEWTFAQRDKVSGVWRDSNIPIANAPAESVTTIVGGTWHAVIEPPVDPSIDTTAISLGSPEARKAAFLNVVRALDPRARSSESLDCANCHIAPDLAAFHRTEKGFDVAAFDGRFKSRYPLETVPKSDEDVVAFDNIHMLSYAGTSLSVSARTANETAAVLEMVNGGDSRTARTQVVFGHFVDQRAP